MAARQCAPGRGGRGAFRRSRAVGHRPARAGVGHDPHLRLRARPPGPVLPHRRRAQRRRRIDRRCAHPHHARRHGARQSAGHRCPRARPMTIRGCASGWPSAVEKALRAEAEPPPRRAEKLPSREARFRGRPARARCPTRHRPNDGGRGQRARPAGLLARLAACDPRRRPPAPFGAYRDLWRARGRRLLPDVGDGTEADRTTRLRSAARSPCSRRPARKPEP